MKIQLVIPKHKDIATQFEDCQIVGIEQLASIPQSVCTLLHIGNCLDFIENRQEVLQKSIQSLRYGGQIVIEGTDLVDLSHALYQGLVKIDEVQTLMFYGRHGCYGLEDVVKELQESGLVIIKQRLQQYKYSIRAERPHVKA